MAQLEDSQTYEHPDGHVTGFAEYGAANGAHVFYFHGLPSSRLEGAVLDEAAKRAGAHVIALDRPGVGLSTLMPKRTLLTWPRLVLELADHLKYDEFYVLGSSAGGPYALACARGIPQDRLKGAGIIAGMSPVALGLDGMSFGSKFSIYATKYAPCLGKKLYEWLVIPAAQDPDPAKFEKMLTEGLAQLDEVDKQIFEDERVKQAFVAAAREHYRQGSKGIPDEWRIFVSDWGFELESIQQSNVSFWCGAKDAICPVDLSRRMVSKVDGARLTEFESDTHYSILVNKGEQILRELTQPKWSSPQNLLD